MEHVERRRADLVLSDRSQSIALRDFLSWAVPGIRLLQIPGEQGLDMLAMLASSAALMSAIRLLPEFLRARSRTRRPPLSVDITIRGESVTLTPDNLDETLPVVTRLLQ